MIYFPETIKQWVQCYWGYLHAFFLLAMHVHSVHDRILKPWRGRLLSAFSSYHVFSPPLSGLNWRSLTPTGGPGLFTSKMATLSTGSAHTPLLGSWTDTRCFFPIFKPKHEPEHFQGHGHWQRGGGNQFLEISNSNHSTNIRLDSELQQACLTRPR
jgi:hypothetical protein